MTDSHDSATGPAEYYPAGPAYSQPSSPPAAGDRTGEPRQEKAGGVSSAASAAEETSELDAAPDSAAASPPADPLAAEPARQFDSAEKLAGARSGWLRRAWRGFRAWRRARPFWGGLFVLLGAAEIFASERAPVAVIVHLGAQGLAGYLIPIVMAVCALLLWFNPTQRLFYSIISVLAALASFVVSNLGGFLIGMLLGVVGGSLAFAWAPVQPGTQARHRRRHRPTAPSSTGIDLVLQPGAEDEVPGPGSAGSDHDEPTAEDSEDATWTGADAADHATSADPAWRGYGRPAPPYQPGPGHGTVVGGSIVLAALSVLTGGLLGLTPASQAQTADPSASGSPSPTASPSPSASPGTSASPSPSPSPSATPSPSISPGASPRASATPTAGASPGASASPSPAPTGTPPPFAVSTSQSMLTASSAVISGFTYDGVVTVQTSTGSEQMMQFSASALDLTGAQLAVGQGGGTMTTTADSLDLTGDVVLYATELSGDLAGIPVTITPSTPIADLLQILGEAGLSQTLTQVLPLQMTNVTTLQPYTSANGMTASAVTIS